MNKLIGEMGKLFLARGGQLIDVEGMMEIPEKSTFSNHPSDG